MLWFNILALCLYMYCGVWCIRQSWDMLTWKMLYSIYLENLKTEDNTEAALLLKTLPVRRNSPFWLSPWHLIFFMASVVSYLSSGYFPLPFHYPDLRKVNSLILSTPSCSLKLFFIHISFLKSPVALLPRKLRNIT